MIRCKYAFVVKADLRAIEVTTECTHILGKCRRKSVAIIFISLLEKINFVQKNIYF